LRGFFLLLLYPRSAQTFTQTNIAFPETSSQGTIFS